MYYNFRHDYYLRIAAQFSVYPSIVVLKYRNSRYIPDSFIMRNKDYPVFFLIVLLLGRDRRFAT